jgi:meiotically up-regulated gene 157 (Mug157) protein
MVPCGEHEPSIIVILTTKIPAWWLHESVPQLNKFPLNLSTVPLYSTNYSSPDLY